MESYKVLCLSLMLNTSVAYLLLNHNTCEGVENPSTFEIVQINCQYKGPGIYVFHGLKTIKKVTMNRLTEEVHVRIEEGSSLEEFMILTGPMSYCYLLTAPASVLVMIQQTPCTTITNSGAEKTTIFSTRDGVTAVSTDEWIKTTIMATIQAKSRNQGAMSTTHDNGYMTYDDGYVETSTITQHAQYENTKIPIAWITTTIATVTGTVTLKYINILSLFIFIMIIVLSFMLLSLLIYNIFGEDNLYSKLSVHEIEDIL